VEGTETPAGGRDKGDPADAASRRLSDRPRISAVPGTEINGLYVTDTQKM